MSIRVYLPPPVGGAQKNRQSDGADPQKMGFLRLCPNLQSKNHFLAVKIDPCLETYILAKNHLKTTSGYPFEGDAKNRIQVTNSLYTP
jgi:hypothetical protein